MHTQNNYELTEDYEEDPDAPMHAQSESSEENRQEVPSGAAIAKMKKLAQKIYDTTPGINECKSHTVTVCHF